MSNFFLKGICPDPYYFYDRVEGPGSLNLTRSLNLANSLLYFLQYLKKLGSFVQISAMNTTKSHHITMCKMFVHPYRLLKELLVCKKFQVVLITLDVDLIENANKSSLTLFIDEIIGREQ